MLYELPEANVSFGEGVNTVIAGPLVVTATDPYATEKIVGLLSTLILNLQ